MGWGGIVTLPPPILSSLILLIIYTSFGSGLKSGRGTGTGCGTGTVCGTECGTDCGTGLAPEETLQQYLYTVPFTRRHSSTGHDINPNNTFKFKVQPLSGYAVCPVSEKFCWITTVSRYGYDVQLKVLSIIHIILEGIFTSLEFKMQSISGLTRNCGNLKTGRSTPDLD
jgi:hypothetical protein